nr:hypothetical protein [Pseudomonas sp. MPR-R5B]
MATELLLGVAFEHREIQLVFVAEHQGLVVGDQLAAQGQDKQADEQPQRPPAAPVLFEPLEASTGHGRQVEHQAFLAAKSIRGSTRV